MAKQSVKELIESCANSFHVIKCREEEELRKLCEKPTAFRIAQALADSLLGDLNYLFNFQYVVDGNGNKVDMNDLVPELERRIQETFLKLTGKRYRFDIVRTLEYRRKKGLAMKAKVIISLTHQSNR